MMCAAGPFDCYISDNYTFGQFICRIWDNMLDIYSGVMI